MEAIYCIFALIMLLNMVQILVVFDKNLIFFFVLYEVYLHSSVDKNSMLEARIIIIKKLFENRGSDLYFDVFCVQIFIQNILGAKKF